ncbi:MAG: ROK family protein [Candidatus Marinimicrobia bacterium]|nr:ROK family protein [Candidatus Neomarinimicrobiota bacterium]
MNRIGIDLGGTKIEGILLGPDNTVLERRRFATNQEDGYKAIVDRITELILQLGKSAGTEYSVGICTPGAISKSTGTIKNSNTTCLIGQPLQHDLEDKISLPVAMENDANCFAIAEATLGAGIGYDVVFGVIMGTGVGGGIVMDGKIVQGRLNIAGEWGHHKISQEGPLCYCGHQGCVETFISGPALEESWRKITGEHLPLKEIVEYSYQAAETTGFPAWKSQFLNNFGLGLANVINILDPDAVILGGGVSNIDFLYSEGSAATQKYIFSDCRDTPVLKNRLGDSAGVFGAALL